MDAVARGASVSTKIERRSAAVRLALRRCADTFGFSENESILSFAAEALEIPHCVSPLVSAIKMLVQILLPIATTLLAYLILPLLRILYHNFSSPLRKILRGPPLSNVLVGNFKEMTLDARRASEWREEYGATFMFHGLLSIPELHTSDIKALNHIITHSEIYQRADSERDGLHRFVGEGLLFAETDQHKRQRRVINPAFTLSHIRTITETFIEKAIRLRDIWTEEITHDVDTKNDFRGIIDVLPGLRKLTLDIIGRAGFGYDFNALEGHTSELDQAFTDLFHAPHANLYAAVRLAQTAIPILKLLPLPGTFVLRSARNRMDAIGRQIIGKSKAGLVDEEGLKALGGRRDILSVLLRANMSPDLPHSQRLSDAEVLAQIPSFFVAGHETTRRAHAAASWALHALSTNVAVQDELRRELLAVPTDNPTLDDLNALPFLEKVVRETMRLHAPVLFMLRKAMTDDVLPLSNPVIDREGKEHWSLPVPKGQIIHLPIWAVNTSTEIWGKDALEFRPDRWESIPAAASAVPGAWANLFTFLAGPHHCIGFRFSLAELKAILFTLIRAFEIRSANVEGGIGPVLSGVMQRPGVLAQENGSGLPLVLKLVQEV
ncbi:hypothetical protein MIND_00908400 [Mycena indigotica]|uniref:Cytochrome P450 n=1 Tax=Mycena indigotica TaxID=2126181 RepID=A0A8H6VWU0_9AGAR|nr:uncharacterized protein MIND_00908400 [Mycena indigotica]KAF7296777.1 hypothetical protein MIND_00908400 [Mycena indigotica]